MQEPYSAGGNVTSYCTKCRLNLDHIIAAMVGDAIAKVKCKTCGSTHKFRDPANPPKARSPRAKKDDAVRTPAANPWGTALAEAKGKERAYAMNAKYRIGDIVVHDRFGKGVVQKLYANKCDVLFQDRERLMASGN